MLISSTAFLRLRTNR
ncbi:MULTISPECIES: erythromycin resistance leader peptide [Actinomycetes]